MTYSVPNPGDEVDGPVDQQLPADPAAEAADPDTPLRVPHEDDADWETKFVANPEAAEEATRERITEQFEQDKAAAGHAEDAPPTD